MTTFFTGRSSRFAQTIESLGGKTKRLLARPFYLIVEDRSRCRFAEFKLVVHLLDLVDQRKNGRIRSIGSPSSNNKLKDTIAWWVPKALGLKPRQAVSIEACSPVPSSAAFAALLYGRL